jgi:hypothetical protein
MDSRAGALGSRWKYQTVALLQGVTSDNYHSVSRLLAKISARKVTLTGVRSRPLTRPPGFVTIGL